MGRLTQLLIERAKRAREQGNPVGHSRGDIAERRLRSSDESYVNIHVEADVKPKQFAGPMPSFRRNDKDRAPARSTVTAELLGDPWPGRPTTPEEIEAYNERVASGEFTPPTRGVALFVPSPHALERHLARIAAEEVALHGRDRERASPGQGLNPRIRKKRHDLLQPEG